MHDTNASAGATTLAADCPRPQFGLRFLFAVTTAVAAAMGLALAKGWGTLPLSCGMIWATLNASGLLQFAQHSSRARSNWIWLAWLLFLVSLCLPVAKGCNDETIRGWRVAAMAPMAELDILTRDVPKGSQMESREQYRFAIFMPLFTLLNLGNLALLLAPLAILLFRFGYGHWQTNIVALAAVVFWAIPWSNPSIPLSGFVVWCVSAAAMLSARQLPWRVWWGMVGIALTMGSTLLV